MNNKRLLAIASLINDVDKVVDVGCDHAYLSLFCLENNKANYFFNIDINVEPLNSGKNNLAKKNLSSKAEFILNDGLKNLDIKADVLVISGMGSNNIIDIVSNSYNTFDKYIVQPNNNIFKLRQFLKDNNFSITNEILVFENNIYYEVLEFIKTKNTNIENDIDIYIGKLFKNNYSLEMYSYLNTRINKIQKIVELSTNENIKKEYKILKQQLFCFKRS